MKLLLYFLSFFFISLNIIAQETALYIGTFTNKDSKGIYRAKFNTDTGELTTPVLAVTSESPSFITYSPNKEYLYAVNISGFASAYMVNKDGKLSFLNKVSTHGASACHIAINDHGDKAVVSNYGGGTAPIFPINEDGSLIEATQVFDHNTENEKARAHSAQFHKNELFVSDLGRNAVYQYILKDGNYELKSEAIVTIKGNPGPRHFSITKNGDYLYVINEYGSSITSIKRNDNGFKTIDEDSTLDETYKGKNSCADIHLSKDERFLYGSNRGENSIAVFKRDLKTGTIEKIQNISVQGDWPRNFTLDPTGKFLLVANKKSNNISVFSIDKTTGKLTFKHSVKTPSPVCLLF